VELPFSWHGNAGNMQMIAGGENHPIHFTNVVYDGVLYTLTYKWPGIERRPCSPIGPFTLDELNMALEGSRLWVRKRSSGTSRSGSTTSESGSYGTHPLT
jgi:hypothetical protein